MLSFTPTCVCQHLLIASAIILSSECLLGAFCFCYLQVQFSLVCHLSTLLTHAPHVCRSLHTYLRCDHFLGVPVRCILYLLLAGIIFTCLASFHTAHTCSACRMSADPFAQICVATTLLECLLGAFIPATCRYDFHLFDIFPHCSHMFLMSAVPFARVCVAATLLTIPSVRHTSVLVLTGVFLLSHTTISHTSNKS